MNSTIRHQEDNEDKMEDIQKATTAMEIVRSENYLSLALPKQKYVITTSYLSNIDYTQFDSNKFFIKGISNS